MKSRGRWWWSRRTLSAGAERAAGGIKHHLHSVNMSIFQQVEVEVEVRGCMQRPGCTTLITQITD